MSSNYLTSDNMTMIERLLVEVREAGSERSLDIETAQRTRLPVNAIEDGMALEIRCGPPDGSVKAAARRCGHLQHAPVRLIVSADHLRERQPIVILEAELVEVTSKAAAGAQIFPLN